ncbi:MAG: dephospho-CoA kinase [Flavobacteriales bacterium]|nr:dephospho-CoA kinase [Flavobacteriales bacterium]MCB9365011.1 dephospho-CoA kinase [Flavobacteriales bacterium]
MNTSLKKNSPLLIGLTGGIGSGKTTVSKIFSAFGVKVFNSDKAAKDIINNDKIVRREIEKLFGNVYTDDKLDTKLVAEKVFGNTNLLSKLNQVVHPEVKKAFIQWVEDNKQEKLLLKEAAILIETGGYKELDDVILVLAEKNKRINRVVKRDNTSKRDVLLRINKQMPDNEKVKYCNYIIYNNEEDLLIPQIEQIIEEINYSSSISSSSSSSE